MVLSPCAVAVEPFMHLMGEPAISAQRGVSTSCFETKLRAGKWSGWVIHVGGMNEVSAVIGTRVEVAKIALRVAVAKYRLAGFSGRVVERDYRLRRVHLCAGCEICRRVDTVVGICRHALFKGQLESASEVFLEGGKCVQFSRRRTSEINTRHAVESAREVGLHRSRRDDAQHYGEIGRVVVGLVDGLLAVLVLRCCRGVEDVRVGDRATPSRARCFECHHRHPEFPSPSWPRCRSGTRS
jgi:hypothetical protein